MPSTVAVIPECIRPAKYINKFTDIMKNYATLYTDLVNGITTIPPINDYYKTLKQRKTDLENKIQQLTSSTERHARDFIDLEQSVQPNTSSIHVLDDLTLWMLLLSYILFAVSIVFWYSHIHMYSVSAIMTSIGGMFLVSFLMLVLGLVVL